LNDSSDHQDHDPTDRPGDSPLVCHCMIVDEATIRRAIASGARTLEAVQDETYASTGCGTCRYDIERLLAEAGYPPEDR
jgi:NAD(P)H-nitrite reductase large subunit